ncbi:TetR family transcriptional regulator [Nitriliruptor alkaliphilus]|uniref:TetR family transcriptional regulator n=1 Tax=Nitriliruptor alkaliphilus TaxID=427918 RepID=UPI0006978A5F|nr:TetR family transcriptional regulator [Nitriliruptor alkaliphilus]
MAASDAVELPAPSELTPQQRERRERILDAAQQLASRGGFDGVQMRTVADKADVALGTLYRYFSSKVHLLVALQHDRALAMVERVAKHPPPGDDPIERATTVLLRSTRALQRDPSLTEALLRAIMVADASAAADVHKVSDVTTQMLLLAIHGPDHVATDEDLAKARVLEMVWLSSLLNWLSGRASSSQVDQDLSTAARLILR